MWIYLRSGREVDFVVPSHRVYHERLSLGESVDARNVVFGFEITDEPVIKTPTLTLDDERAYRVLEQRTPAILRRFSSAAFDSRLYTEERRALQYGRFSGTEFIREQEVAGLLLAIAHKGYDPTMGPYTISARPDQPFPEIIEPCWTMLQYVLLMRLPGASLQQAMLSLQTPMISARIRHHPSSYQDIEPWFPEQMFFDNVGQGSAAIMTTILETGKVVHQ